MNQFLDLPYISIGEQHDPEIEDNRRTIQPDESIRIYHYEKKFLIYVNNKETAKMGLVNASECVKLIKNKFPHTKICDLNFVFPVGFAHEDVVKELTTKYVDESKFETFLYKFLVLLI